MYLRSKFGRHQITTKDEETWTPKGAALTVIGLPKKKGKMFKSQEFRRRSPREKEKGDA